MLNQSRVVTYAISEKDYDKTLLTDELIDPDKQMRLELWAYNPKQFSEDNSADELKSSGASKFLSNLVRADIVAPVSGYRKGKYRFKK